MCFRATYKSLNIKPLWIGGLVEGTLTIQANITGCKGVWLEYQQIGSNRWEVIIKAPDDDENDYIAIVYCTTKELIGTIMYVQVNNETIDTDGNVRYIGEVYTLDTNQKICDFEWEIDWGVTSIEPKIFDGSMTDFIDQKCYEIWNNEQGYDNEEEVY